MGGKRKEGEEERRSEERGGLDNYEEQQHVHLAQKRVSF